MNDYLKGCKTEETGSHRSVHVVLVRDSLLGGDDADDMSDMLMRYCVYDALWYMTVCQQPQNQRGSSRGCW